MLYKSLDINIIYPPNSLTLESMSEERMNFSHIINGTI